MTCFWGHLQSTFHGLNDKVAEAAVAAIGSLLQLVPARPTSVNRRGLKVVHAPPRSCEIHSRSMLISAVTTDPEAEEEYQRGDGEYGC